MSLFGNDDRRQQRGPEVPHEGFEVFWSAYPRREARLDAIKAWNKAQPSPATVECILEALEWQGQQKNWQEAKRFIPLPASYLRGERWKDEKREPPPIIPTHRLTPFEQARRAGLK